jgi:hypothetical protein
MDERRRTEDRRYTPFLQKCEQHGQMIQDLQVQVADLATIKPIVERIDRIVNGNGVPGGLVAKMAAHTQLFESLVPSITAEAANNRAFRATVYKELGSIKETLAENRGSTKAEYVHEEKEQFKVKWYHALFLAALAIFSQDISGAFHAALNAVFHK